MVSQVARIARVLLPAAAAATLLLAPAASAHRRAPTGRASASCQITGLEANLGPTYVSFVQAGGSAGCSQALRLITSYYRCRVRNGGVAGYCTAAVEGFRCEEDRYSVVTVQYDAHVLCTKGRARVRYGYTQIT